MISCPVGRMPIFFPWKPVLNSEFLGERGSQRPRTMERGGGGSDGVSEEEGQPKGFLRGPGWKKRCKQSRRGERPTTKGGGGGDEKDAAISSGMRWQTPKTECWIFNQWISCRHLYLSVSLCSQCSMGNLGARYDEPRRHPQTDSFDLQRREGEGGERRKLWKRKWVFDQLLPREFRVRKVWKEEIQHLKHRWAVCQVPESSEKLSSKYFNLESVWWRLHLAPWKGT